MIYLEPPEDFNPVFEISIGTIQHKGEILLVKRNPNKRQGNKWGMPGGKLDAGETPIQAFIREVYEETGISLEKSEIEYFKSVYVRYPDYDFHSHMFSTKLSDEPAVKLQKEEHSAYQWFTPTQALELESELVLDNDVTLKMFYQL